MNECRSLYDYYYGVYHKNNSQETYEQGGKQQEKTATVEGCEIGSRHEIEFPA